jgi:hypothetical protein
MATEMLRKKLNRDELGEWMWRGGGGWGCVGWRLGYVSPPPVTYSIIHTAPRAALTYLQNNTTTGNYIFWIAFCVVGQPVCVLLYYHDYVVGIRPALLVLRQAAAVVGGAAAAAGEAAAAAAVAGAGVAGTMAAGIGAAAAAALGGALGDGTAAGAEAASMGAVAGNCTLGAASCGVS